MQASLARQELCHAHLALLLEGVALSVIMITIVVCAVVDFASMHAHKAFVGFNRNVQLTRCVQLVSQFAAMHDTVASGSQSAGSVALTWGTA